MKFILLSGLLLMANILIKAQTISNGLYVNKERNEFVIIKNDTVQFRVYTDGAFVFFNIGEGLLESKGDKKYIVLSPSLKERTSILYCHPRSDSGVSIKVFSQDSLPIPYVQIKVSRLQDKSPYIAAYTDINGQLFLDKKQIDYFDKKDILINASLVGYTETETKILLGRGYDYIIKSRMLNDFPSGVVTGNKWEIRQMSEDEISIGKNTITRLKKVADDYPYSDFPFNMDVETSGIPK